MICRNQLKWSICEPAELAFTNQIAKIPNQSSFSRRGSRHAATEQQDRVPQVQRQADDSQFDQDGDGTVVHHGHSLSGTAVARA